jgi:DNA-binding transcriptional MerR regulator
MGPRRRIPLGQAARLFKTSGGPNIADYFGNIAHLGTERAPPNQKNDLGYCEYSEKDLARIRIIHTLRTAGYSIASIRKMFLEFDHGKLRDTAEKTLAAVLPDPDAPIVYVTDRWPTTLLEHIERAGRATGLLFSMQETKENVVAVN